MINISIGPLETFYLVGAIMFVGFVILLYPTLKERSRSRKLV
ncbi:MAG: hypothetical protein AAB569_01625 [Patescibacteria group bacterium]